ncbi:MAG: Acetylornithine aminotransferase [Thermoanaerobacterales bacterium 50_218]|nr:MAG: Acetylornithine aminotransferase [Thermoanaerobacterales bacterium 50_218]HAA88976.1 acetylornithine transaminase [Peptococcaceae bacterium]
MTGKQVIEIGRKRLMPTYAQFPLVLVKGEGVRVWDPEGRSYLDFVGGIAVNAVGHCHPRVVAAVKEQAGKLLHCSNLYWFPQPVKLAQELASLSGLDRAFFCNSGAEANEAAIKLVRKYAWNRGQENPEIIAFTNSFHGRTLGALAATGQEKFWKGFEPLPGGFHHLPFNGVEALKKAVDSRTAAILVEPVQGEGGIHVATPEFMETLAELREKHGLLLVFDEVQCGLGRTGKMFAFEHYGVRPDVLILAKALGGGLPIGAVLAREEVAAVFQPGSHGSTFGGNPVACEAAFAVLKVLQEQGLVEKAARIGNYFKKRLEELQQRFGLIKEVRGLGLMLGMELDRPGKELVTLCQQRGLLVNCTAEKVIRFLPPLVVTEREVDEAVAILEDALEEFASEQPGT